MSVYVWWVVPFSLVALALWTVSVLVSQVDVGLLYFKMGSARRSIAHFESGHRAPVDIRRSR